MSRRHLTFACESAQLVGTLDDATGTAGLLWIGGGNEIRSGAFAGQARLAAEIAAAGFPVFRFDRRGVGDSEGVNRGFRDSAPDIAAALAAFRNAAPQVTRVVGFGNCDAASALMLAHGAGCDALVLSNPWTIEHDDGSPSGAAIRARYAGKLRNPRDWVRLVRGQVSLGKPAKGIARAATPAPTRLAEEIAEGLGGFCGAVHILLAERDRTAQAFLANWLRSDPRLTHCPGASHAFVEPDARRWLSERMIGALADEQAR